MTYLPPGKIFITHNGNRNKWYYNMNGNISYISKKNRLLAEQLSYKKYLLLCLEEALHEKNAIELYLRHHIADTPKSELLLTESTEYQELISPYFSPQTESLQEWLASPYPHNPKNPEQLTHKASSSIHVRSKSEAMIDMVLYTNHIPFRYECELRLGTSTIYSDFTILHPETHKLYFYEHFGLMDHPDYAANALSKLRLYISNNIIPGDNLITSYETKDNPLSIKTIQDIVNHYFLT